MRVVICIYIYMLKTTYLFMNCKKKSDCELLNNISCSRRSASRPGVLGRNEDDVRGVFFVVIVLCSG